MNNLKLIIVEDNESDLMYLKTLLNHYVIDVEIVAQASNARTAFNLIMEHQPDIIVLDMELNNGSGMEVLEMLDREGEFQVIAYSSHMEHAYRCYVHNVIDFLHKPYKLEDLLKSINKVRKHLYLMESSNSLGHERSSNRFAKFLALSSLTEALIVKPEEIAYLKADGGYTKVVLKNGRRTLTTRNMGIFEKLLDPNVFYRIHHSYIINLNEVVSINRPKTTFCTLRSNEKIPVSVRKVAGLLSHLYLKD